MVLSTLSAQVPRSQLLYTLERHAVYFVRQTACKRFSTNWILAPSRQSRSFHRHLDSRNFRNAYSTHVNERGPLNLRRWKSDDARNETMNTSELQPQLGDDPPLYDAKPPFWAQWVYVLLALDVLFIGASVDMVLNKWSHRVPDTSTDPPGKKWELRPLWHRLSLATFEILIGAAAGALILVSRDRIVWRIRIRRVPISSLTSGPGMLPRPGASTTEQTINVMTLETGSGRTKRFIVKHSMFSQGRDLSEIILRIGGIPTTFFLSMNRARVLGLTADEIHNSTILKEIKKMNEARLSSINANVPGEPDAENSRIKDLRKALVYAWEKVGGGLNLPRAEVAMRGWTSGPVTERR